MWRFAWRLACPPALSFRQGRRVQHPPPAFFRGARPGPHGVSARAEARHKDRADGPRRVPKRHSSRLGSPTDGRSIVEATDSAATCMLAGGEALLRSFQRSTRARLFQSVVTDIDRAVSHFGADLIDEGTLLGGSSGPAGGVGATGAGRVLAGGRGMIVRSVPSVEASVSRPPRAGPGSLPLCGLQHDGRQDRATPRPCHCEPAEGRRGNLPPSGCPVAFARAAHRAPGPRLLRRFAPRNDILASNPRNDILGPDAALGVTSTSATRRTGS